MTGSMYEGLGYTPNSAQSAATKPVSGESIVTFLERMDAIGEHGTKKGYEAGCRGSHCPGRDAVGMSCSQASIRYAGDMGYRRRVDAGLTAEQIWVEDQAAHVVMPKVNVRDPRGTVAFDGEQLTVEDSVAVYEADEDDTAEEARESVPQQQGKSVTVSPGERPAAAGRPKWSVKRVWVAVSPQGKLHGPFESQPEAVGFVGNRMPKPRAKPERKTSDARGRRIDWAKYDALIRERHAAEVPDVRIAAEIGVSQFSLSKRRAFLGLPALPQGRRKS